MPDAPLPVIDPDMSEDEVKACGNAMLHARRSLPEMIAWANQMMAARWERWRSAADAAELERLRVKHSQRVAKVKPAKVEASEPTLFQEAS